MTRQHMGNMVVVFLIIVAGGCLGGGDPTPTPWADPGTPVKGSIVAPGAVVNCENVPCATVPAPAGPPEAREPLVVPLGGE